MKTILLMSCALCAGMNGYGMMVDSMRESNNVGLLNKSKTKNNATSLLSPKTDQKACNLKRIGGELQNSEQKRLRKESNNETESEPRQKEFSVELSQAEWEAYEARDQLSSDIGEKLWPLLDSADVSNTTEIHGFIKEILNNHSGNKKLAFRCILSCLNKAFICGDPSTEDAAEKILAVLDTMSFEDLFPTTSTEE